MTEQAAANGADPSAVLFSARLTPHRSLSPAGFAFVMLFVASVCLTVGIAFWLAGVWPIMGFMGADILLFWLALKMSYRSGRQYEEVEVSRERLSVRQVTPTGAAREHAFNPFGTFFNVERHPEIGVTAMALQNRGRRVTLGSFLDPESKETFAEAFGAAVAQAKR